MSTSIISLDQLRFRWRASASDVINIEKFTVAKREKLFIKGPSGCGKSTLLNLVAGVFEPTGGNIHVLKQSISQLSHAQRDVFRADHIGFVFQQFNLLPYLSLTDNVILPCHFSKLRKRKTLSAYESLAAAASDLLSQLGIVGDDLKKNNVMQLSVGQQQRVAVARALIGSPQIVIADEPTSSLDDDSQADFLKLLFSLCDTSGSTLLFVSHNRQLESTFDRVVNLPQLNRVGNHAA
jgi:putative ABC transport system ATP-binding protein